MKAVMISIHPKWCELIASGKKTVVVRKTKPKLETPFKCYIYCSQGNLKELGIIGNEIYHKRMKVIGEFVCDKAYDLIPFGVGVAVVDSSVAPFDDAMPPEKFCEISCLTGDEICDYLGEKVGYAWHITDLVIYDKPRELREFTGLRKTKFGYAPYEIKRPFQSWGYVYEDYT
jgi:predicted transcriptional regulator